MGVLGFEVQPKDVMALLMNGDLQRSVKYARWEKCVHQQVQPPLVPSLAGLAEVRVSAWERECILFWTVKVAIALHLPKDVGVSHVSSGVYQPAVLAGKLLAHKVLYFRKLKQEMFSFYLFT